MPKIKVMVNAHGQPVGDNARRFSGAVGVRVRQKISIACADWRLVDPHIKDEVWIDMKVFLACNYFLTSQCILYGAALVLFVGCIVFSLHDQNSFANFSLHTRNSLILMIKPLTGF